ncbi:MAG: V-type ATP synthase subunit E [Cellulosilyticaceae bacterium]
MVTIEQKLSLFSKLLQQDIKNEIGGKLALIEEEYQEKQRVHNEAVDKEARLIVDKAIKRANIKKTEMTSKAKMHTKKQMMLAKEQCVGKCMEKLQNRVVEFVKSKEYEVYLLNVIDTIQALGQVQEQTIIYITTEDIENYRDLVVDRVTQRGIDKKYLQIEASQVPIIGGMILEVPEENIRIDLSIATLIQDHKALIVQRVFEAIGQVGEISE